MGSAGITAEALFELQPGWALVKVLAAGICSSDIPRIFTKGTYHFPGQPQLYGSWQLPLIELRSSSGVSRYSSR